MKLPRMVELNGDIYLLNALDYLETPEIQIVDGELQVEHPNSISGIKYEITDTGDFVISISYEEFKAQINPPAIVMQIPKFIKADRNGHALSMAIQTSLEKLREDSITAYNLLHDIGTMPEWRLDDMAWEWNMTWYDFSMPVDIKREMVKRAEEISRGIGTPGLLKYMLEAVFETVNILEWEDYDGEPYHFMVEVGGNRAGDMEGWAQKAVEIFKPLSRVFDGFVIQTTNTAPIFTAAVLEIGFRIELEGS